MKKYLKLQNIIAALGIVCILLYFCPSFSIYQPSSEGGSSLGTVNLFIATFGGAIPNSATYSNARLVTCAGLLLAFIFTIVAIAFCVSKIKFKFGSLIACPFFITSGILLFCALPMLRFTNYNRGLSESFQLGLYGWSIAIGVIFCVLGVLCLIDTMMTFAKPKVQEVY